MGVVRRLSTGDLTKKRTALLDAAARTFAKSRIVTPDERTNAGD
jgi:hypothetical protein